MNSPTLANLIFVAHLVFFVFMLYCPFSKQKVFNLFFLITAPFILLHWVTNNDVCALTEVEKILRGGKCESKDTFFGSLVAPVYNFDKHPYVSAMLLRSVLIVLWFIAFYNVKQKRDNDPIDEIYKSLRQTKKPLTLDP